MIPGKYNFRTRYKDDTSAKVEFKVTETVDDVTTDKDLTSVTIEMKIATAKAATPSLTFAIGTGITLTDASAGEFEVDAFDVTLDSATYVYDIQFTEDSVISTYLVGSFKVAEDV